MKKYQAGGRARSKPSYEEDTTPPRGMRNFRFNDENAVDGDLPSYEEDRTPPRGMMRPRRDNDLPMPPPPTPPAPRRMKAGGAVTRGDGCAMKGKTKGRMV